MVVLLVSVFPKDHVSGSLHCQHFAAWRPFQFIRGVDLVLWLFVFDVGLVKLPSVVVAKVDEGSSLLGFDEEIRSVLEIVGSAHLAHDASLASTKVSDLD